ncbi:uncharacterized protein [Parasteatoda tepidariorum]|uniref:uncharacterized protein n=1 Tax=Parasteatoda tepidariorum TaxID=114398 RepID=UPI001C71B408|nr:uncharacterized protein LOC107456602 [Parasteatoda tepidariorum]
MKTINKILVLIQIGSSVSGQLPAFLQRFMPRIAGYSLLTPSASHNSPSYFSPQQSFGSLTGQGSFGNPNLMNFGPYSSSLRSQLSNYGNLPMASSANFAASYPQRNIYQSSGSSFAPSSFGQSPYGFSSNFGLNPASFGGHKLSPGTSLTDFDAAESFEGGADFLDDFPGFSNADFAKDLNFAGSQAIRYREPFSVNDFTLKKRSGTL